MGSGLSQDQDLQQQNQEQRNTSQHNDANSTPPSDQEPKKIHVPQCMIKSDTNTSSKATRDQVGLLFPHYYDEILKDADSLIDRSSTDKLYEQLYAGVFLNQKRKRYWVDKKLKANCFMVYARDLSITWSENNRLWHWPLVQDNKLSDDQLVPAAELLDVCWLEIHGRLDTTKLSPSIVYEVVFIVMVKDPAYGWEVPVNLRLVLPDGTKQEHKENMLEKPRAKWIEIPAGEFITSANEKNGDQIEFSLYEYEGGVWKRGLVIKGAVIRPKA